MQRPLSDFNVYGGKIKEIHQEGGMAFDSGEIKLSGCFYNMDAQEAVQDLSEKWKGRIQLVYIDPPFYTGQSFEFRQKIGTGSFDGAGILSQRAYSDQWENREEYLEMMRMVLRAARELLGREGAVFVHADYRMSAYLKVMLDEIFGEDNFMNEIIWHYKSGGRSKKHFSRKHDTILFYRKTEACYFDLEAVGIPRGKARRNHMKKQIDEDGRVYYSINSGGKEYRYYEDAKVYPSDVWDDISHLQQKDPERTGYDTQKPEALLERIIRVSSRPGDWVADFFAGSGTTLAQAIKSGRNYIGVDNGIFALHTCRKRLAEIKADKSICFCYETEVGALIPEGVQIELEPAENGNEGDIRVSLVDYKLPKADPTCRGAASGLTTKKRKAVDPKGLSFDDRDAFKKSGIMFVDQWSVGRLRDGMYQVTGFTSRSRNGGDVMRTLILADGLGEPAASIVDIYGRQILFYLKKATD